MVQPETLIRNASLRSVFSPAILRPELPRGNLSDYSHVRPLFKRRIPWWATRAGTAGILVALSTVTVWSVRNALTRTVSILDADGNETSERQLAPKMQRVGWAGFNVLLGLTSTGVLFARRPRTIRSVYVVSKTSPAVPSSRRLFLQSAVDIEGKGYDLPMSSVKCEGEKLITRLDPDANLKIGFWNAEVDGTSYDSYQGALDKFDEEWRKLLPSSTQE
ncbi:hypothetical protein CC2G_013813 [Coprinopsis cinerea AmutBmut pab1-1]|nr:hypothetical protein CC2G_013813 [Coprinopsis cinerea AmutBmut pab1-1]